MEDRLEKFRQKMAQAQIDSVLLLSTEKRINKNVFYLTGFTGEDGFLHVTKDRAVLFVDGRYPEQAREQAWDGITVELTEYPQLEFLGKKVVDSGAKNIGLEESIVSYLFAKKFSEKCEGVEFKNADNLGRTAPSDKIG